MQLANNTNVTNSKVDELASALGGLTIGGEVRQAIDGRPGEGPHALPSAQACSTCAPALVTSTSARQPWSSSISTSICSRDQTTQVLQCSDDAGDRPRDGYQEYVKGHYLSSIFRGRLPVLRLQLGLEESQCVQQSGGYDMSDYWYEDSEVFLEKRTTLSNLIVFDMFDGH
jgi:hypothetical protein